MKFVNIHFLLFWLWITLGTIVPQGLQAQIMTLEQCTEAALSQNKNLLAARSNQQAGDLRIREAKSNLAPKATASADYLYSTNLPYQLMPLSTFDPTAPEGSFKEIQFGVPHNLGIRVQLAVPLYNPQVKKGIQGAELAAEIGDLTVEKSEEQVIFEVAYLYYTAQVLQHQLRFVDSNLVNAAQLRNTVQLLRAQDLAKGTDVSKIELQQAQLESQRAQLAGKHAQTINGLNFLMGLDLHTPLTIARELEQDTLADYPRSPSVDVRMSEIQNRRLSNELDVLKKSTQPTVSLVANYGLTGFGYSKQPDPFLRVFPVGFIGAQATYPLWNKSTRFKIAQKETEIASQKLQTEQTYAQSELTIANAILLKRIAEENLPAIQRQIDLAQVVYQQTRLQHEQGIATLTDILWADNALREAQNSYIQALVELLKAKLELKKASGALND